MISWIFSPAVEQDSIIAGIAIATILVIAALILAFWRRDDRRYEAGHASGAHTWPQFHAAPGSRKTAPALTIDLPGRGRGNTPPSIPPKAVPAPAGQPPWHTNLTSDATRLAHDNHALTTVTALASGQHQPRPVYELPPGWRDEGWHAPPGMVPTVSCQQPKWLRDFLNCPAPFIASLSQADKNQFENMLAGAS